MDCISTGWRSCDLINTYNDDDARGTVEISARRTETKPQNISLEIFNFAGWKNIFILYITDYWLLTNMYHNDT